MLPFLYNPIKTTLTQLLQRSASRHRRFLLSTPNTPYTVSSTILSIVQRSVGQLEFRQNNVQKALGYFLMPFVIGMKTVDIADQFLEHIDLR